MTHSKTSSALWTWQVPETSLERADKLILQAYESHPGDAEAVLPKLTRTQLHRFMDEGRVLLNGQPLKANRKLRGGSWVEIEIPPPLPTELIAENIPIEIIYQDSHIAVINKPVNLTVHPSPTQMEGTLVHALLHHMTDLSGIGGVLRPGIVHRLDKNTSGALVISKTDEAHHKLVEIFSKHAIERTYWALCYGSPGLSRRKEPLKIETLIGRSPTDRKKMSAKVQDGRLAVTYLQQEAAFAVKGKKPFASWLKATLETGRTHQVRVHLTDLGTSLFGDPTYGKPTSQHPKWIAVPKSVQELIALLPGQALHARVLGFDHPITGVPLRFEATPPPEFEKLLEALKHYSA